MLQLAAECGPEQTYSSKFSFMNVHSEGLQFAQANSTKNLIPSSWILLDSQSTVSVFKNRHLLTNIRPSDRPLRVHTNGGTQMSSDIGTVKNFGDVWFNSESLANILSMAKVRKKCRITMDTSVEASMNVHRRDGTIMKFREYRSGLYYFDAGASAPPAEPNDTSTTSDYLFLNTVENNKQAHTRREIERADRARALYKMIGRPSEQEFVDILQKNLIRNCPVTVDDAKRALQIYGPDTATLKGKTVKKKKHPEPPSHHAP